MCVHTIFELWKGLRSAEKSVDVRRQTSTNSVDAGRRQKVWAV